MSSALYPWQLQAWQQIQQYAGRWPHAILLHGPEGIGKTVFAESLAQSLLCETPQSDGQACDTCLSCGWFSQYNHPDYRRLRPEVLDDDEAESEPEESSKSSAKSSKAPSREIVIAQVRALSDFMTISTHRNGRRVIVIYPAEAMNVAAANALLKSLEEPGPNTVFILVTRSIDGLLPTLVSRCRQFVLTMPTAGQAMQWLKAHAIPTPEQFLVEHGGAPLAALAAAQSENHGDQIEFLRYLQHPEWDGALKIADKLSKTPMTLVVSWMQRWLYDVFSYKLSGKIRYYPHYQKEINGVASVMGLPALLSQLDRSSQRRAVAEHPLNAKLVIEEMLLEYVSSIKQL